MFIGFNVQCSMFQCSRVQRFNVQRFKGLKFDIQRVKSTRGRAALQNSLTELDILNVKTNNFEQSHTSILHPDFDKSRYFGLWIWDLGFMLALSDSIQMLSFRYGSTSVALKPGILSFQV